MSSALTDGQEQTLRHRFEELDRATHVLAEPEAAIAEAAAEAGVDPLFAAVLFWRLVNEGELAQR